ncbi:MAG: cyclic nucleotide-binding domain-containing protein, partial [Rubrivivax sp.]|nr:cyclic nucleotide-binding domain-containing protein [Rubrivivax sp.]
MSDEYQLRRLALLLRTQQAAGGRQADTVATARAALQAGTVHASAALYLHAALLGLPDTGQAAAQDAAAHFARLCTSLQAHPAQQETLRRRFAMLASPAAPSESPGAVGVGLGLLLSLLTFAVRMNRSLVHERYTAAARPSRRIYPAPVETRLRPLREGIEVFELDGALFFGSSDRLLDEADALGSHCRCLVLDLRRVSAVDESGAVTLQQVQARLKARGIELHLAGWVEGTAAVQSLHSFGLHLPHWPDADRAIEAAELRLLSEAVGELPGDVRAMADVPLAQSSLLAGLDAAQVALVATLLQPRQLAAGEMLFAEGEPGDRLYVVGQGSVSLLSLPDAHGRTQRYLSVSPGMMFGETAMLDGGGRTAGAVADAPTRVYVMTLHTLDEIGRTHPDVAIRLHRNIALHLSQRLRGAAGAWRSSTR